MDEIEKQLLRHLARAMRNCDDFLAEALLLDLREYQKHRNKVAV